MRSARTNATFLAALTLATACTNDYERYRFPRTHGAAADADGAGGTGAEEDAAPDTGSPAPDAGADSASSDR